MVVMAPANKLEAHLLSDDVQSWRAGSSRENTLRLRKTSEWKGKLQMMRFRTRSPQMRHIGTLTILSWGSLKTAEVGKSLWPPPFFALLPWAYNTQGALTIQNPTPWYIQDSFPCKVVIIKFPSLLTQKLPLYYSTSSWLIGLRNRV